MLTLPMLWVLAHAEHNPIVQMEARLGLSPAPLERFFGIRGPFSGMTEAAYQLAHFNVGASLVANVLTIPFLLVIAIAVWRWERPVLRSKGDELLFLGGTIAATVLNNVVPAALA
ncbi:DUF2752 domain-containing protein [Sphingomonas mesophila]|uniref:DUF2752 domain-containing protein n=1 Tax=Sphingomonas mesophila TaxID=2303576 RepID=UPI0013C30A83|nr:DUF2752 domain-containing protein [Sphingomonas mesophila]